MLLFLLSSAAASASLTSQLPLWSCRSFSLPRSSSTWKPTSMDRQRSNVGVYMELKSGIKQTTGSGTCAASAIFSRLSSGEDGRAMDAHSLSAGRRCHRGAGVSGSTDDGPEGMSAPKD